MHTEYRWAMTAGRGRPRGARGGRHRRRTRAARRSAPAPTPGRWRATSSRAATTRARGQDLAMPGYGEAPRARPRLRVPARPAHAGHRRRERSGRRRRAGPRLLRRPPLRRRAAPSSPPLRPKLNLPAEYGLSWLLPRLVGLRVGPPTAAVRPGVLRRGGRSRSGWSTAVVPADELAVHSEAYAPTWPATSPRRRWPRPRRQLSRDLFPAIRRHSVRRSSAARRDGHRARLRRGQPGPGREAPARVLSRLSPRTLGQHLVGVLAQPGHARRRGPAGRRRDGRPPASSRRGARPHPGPRARRRRRRRPRPGGPRPRRPAC